MCIYVLLDSKKIKLQLIACQLIDCCLHEKLANLMGKNKT